MVAPYELIVLAVTGRNPFGTQSASTTVVLALIELAVVGPMISALSIHAVRMIAEDERPRVGDVVMRGLRVLPTVAAAEIIAAIGIGVGFLAFVIPGVILWIRWAVVAQVAAIENENWIEALKRSTELTAGNGLHVLGVLLAVVLISALLTNVAVAVAGAHTTAGGMAFGIALATIARSFLAVALAVLFFDLLARRGMRGV